MSYGDSIAPTAYNLDRGSAFSYQCNACSRCCHDKAIRIGPYEILRLARHLGITTTDFIARHTEAGGTVLLTRDENDRACVFLNREGCSVHSERPMVCRIYPLACAIEHDGSEKFGHMIPHPETAGVHGTGATVADFLEQQGVAPYFEMARRYKVLYREMVDVLERLDSDELERRADRRDDVDEMPAGAAASPWIDIDQTVAKFCDATSRPVPVDIDATVAVHIEAVEAWIASF
jgi:Fe-S-cluster containining protein